MFNWLKNLFGKKDHNVDPSFPFPTAKDQAVLAPYKVEAPASKTEEVKKPAPAKKPAAPKKRAPAKTGGSTRGRKPKAKPAQ